MRQWRVGTFPMGLLLIAAGIGLFWAQTNPVTLSEQVLRWWPAIFVILGVEVLLHSFWLKGEEKRIKYDVFSIFMIFIIIMTGMGLQSIQEVGVAERIKWEINTHTYSLQTEPAEIAVEKGIEKVVVEASGSPRLKIRTGSEGVITYHLQARVRAQSAQEGQALLEEQAQVKSHRSGSVLYLNLAMSSNHNCFDESVDLILPDHLAVETEQKDGSLQVMPAAIKNNWLIRGDGELDVSLPAQSDLKLYVVGSRQYPGEPDLTVQGNLEWTDSEGQPVKYGGEKTGSQTDQKDSSAADKGIHSQLGKGTYQMTIIYRGNTIRVNQLP